jgi:hypothetical protein
LHTNPTADLKPVSTAYSIRERGCIPTSEERASPIEGE